MLFWLLGNAPCGILVCVKIQLSDLSYVAVLIDSSIAGNTFPSFPVLLSGSAVLLCFSNVLMLLKFWLYNLKDMRYHKLRSVGIHSITSSYFFFKCLFGGRICIIPTYLSSAGLLAFC